MWYLSILEDFSVESLKRRGTQQSLPPRLDVEECDAFEDAGVCTSKQNVAGEGCQGKVGTFMSGMMKWGKTRLRASSSPCSGGTSTQ